jgi:oxalate decarboxylase/phosphoglucose isomerase-like protein (cupin superfamily)
MGTTELSSFDLASTYVHLSDDARASAVPVSPDFWATIKSRTDLEVGRLVTVTRQTGDWSHWEMHPAGDEVVSLLSGAVDFVLQLPSGEHTLALRGRATTIVPQGVWHRAIVREPGEMMFITPGAGTAHRPV